MRGGGQAYQMLQDRPLEEKNTSSRWTANVLPSSKKKEAQIVTSLCSLISNTLTNKSCFVFIKYPIVSSTLITKNPSL